MSRSNVAMVVAIVGSLAVLGGVWASQEKSAEPHRESSTEQPQEAPAGSPLAERLAQTAASREALCREGMMACADSGADVGVAEGAKDWRELADRECGVHAERFRCGSEVDNRSLCLKRTGDCSFETHCKPAESALRACIDGGAESAGGAPPKLFYDFLKRCFSVKRGKSLESICDGAYRIDGAENPVCQGNVDDPGAFVETAIVGNEDRAYCTGRFTLDETQDQQELWASIVAFAKAALWGHQPTSRPEEMYFTFDGLEAFCDRELERGVSCKVAIR